MEPPHTEEPCTEPKGTCTAGGAALTLGPQVTVVPLLPAGRVAAAAAAAAGVTGVMEGDPPAAAGRCGA